MDVGVGECENVIVGERVRVDVDDFVQVGVAVVVSDFVHVSVCVGVAVGVNETVTLSVTEIVFVFVGEWVGV